MHAWKTTREAECGMQHSRSRDLSHSTGGPCMEEWRGGVGWGRLLISKRHEETGWGESRSRPQISPPGLTAAATTVVRGTFRALCSFSDPWEFIQFFFLKSQSAEWLFVLLNDSYNWNLSRLSESFCPALVWCPCYTLWIVCENKICNGRLFLFWKLCDLKG